MSEFFRFLRPVEFNIQRSVIEAIPFGGVCVHARSLEPGDKRLSVGFSVCPMTELFNREVAKKKAEEQDDWYVCPKSFSAEDIINSLLDHPQDAALIMFLVDPSADEDRWEELAHFTKAVQHIRQTKRQAKQFQQNHIDAVQALQIGERYNDLQS
jgi:hypothetical protein